MVDCSRRWLRRAHGSAQLEPPPLLGFPRLAAGGAAA